MAVHLYGNVNGSYQRPTINLLEMARAQNKKPIKFHDTEVGRNMQGIKVDISEEGLRALHGTKMKGSVDLQKQQEELRYISEHQPVETFTNRFSGAMQDSFVQFVESHSDNNWTIQKKTEVIFHEFQSICDEIITGYEEGNRVRFIEDFTTEDGYRRLSKEDELAILLSEFADFVEGRFGKEHQEQSVKVAETLNELQKVKQEMGESDIRYYEPERIPEDLVENLIEKAKQYVEGKVRG